MEIDNVFLNVEKENTDVLHLVNNKSVPSFSTLPDLIEAVFGGEYVTFNKDNKVQCYSSRRSLGDLYQLAKYYFPETTAKQVQLHLLKLIKEEKIRFWFCTDIDKRVYMRKGIWFSHYEGNGTPSKDEYGITTEILNQLENEI